MDILFSPYGVGGMPKATIADIERTTEELLKSSSFQRMLDLENKYKVCMLAFGLTACLELACVLIATCMSYTGLCLTLR